MHRYLKLCAKLNVASSLYTCYTSFLSWSVSGFTICQLSKANTCVSYLYYFYPNSFIQSIQAPEYIQICPVPLHCHYSTLVQTTIMLPMDICNSNLTPLFSVRASLQATPHIVASDLLNDVNQFTSFSAYKASL